MCQIKEVKMDVKFSCQGAVSFDDKEIDGTLPCGVRSIKLRFDTGKEPLANLEILLEASPSYDEGSDTFQEPSVAKVTFTR